MPAWAVLFLIAVPLFAQYVRDLNLQEPVAAVSPDTGRTKLAGKFAEMIGGDLVVLNKERPEQQVALVTTVIGDVEGKVAVMTDDIVDTAGTLVAGAAALKEAGALRVYACATHGLFNGPALERIASSEMSAIAAEPAPGAELSGPAIETEAVIGEAVGPQSGNEFRPPMGVRLTCSVPSASAVQTSKFWPPASRTKAIRVPSGDQLGSASKIEPFVRFVAPEPSAALIVQTVPQQLLPGRSL